MQPGRFGTAPQPIRTTRNPRRVGLALSSFGGRCDRAAEDGLSRHVCDAIDRDLVDAVRSLLVRYAVPITLNTAGSTDDLPEPDPDAVKNRSSVRFRQAAPTKTELA